MAAIDDLKEQRQELTAQIDVLQANKVALQQQDRESRDRYAALIAEVDAQIARVRDRRSAVVFAIRDLTDNWKPV